MGSLIAPQFMELKMKISLVNRLDKISIDKNDGKLTIIFSDDLADIEQNKMSSKKHSGKLLKNPKITIIRDWEGG